MHTWKQAVGPEGLTERRVMMTKYPIQDVETFMTSSVLVQVSPGTQSMAEEYYLSARRGWKSHIFFQQQERNERQI